MMQPALKSLLPTAPGNKKLTATQHMCPAFFFSFFLQCPRDSRGMALGTVQSQVWRLGLTLGAT